MVEIVKHCAFGVPPIIIGHHLDEASFCVSFVKTHQLKVATSKSSKKKENNNCAQDGIKGLDKRLASPKWSTEETALWVDVDV